MSHLNVIPFSTPSDDIERSELVEALKARVDSGDVAAVAYIVVNRDGSVSTNYVSGPQIFALLGGCKYLADRIVKDIEDKSL